MKKHVIKHKIMKIPKKCSNCKNAESIVSYPLILCLVYAKDCNKSILNCVKYKAKK